MLSGLFFTATARFFSMFFPAFLVAHLDWFLVWCPRVVRPRASGAWWASVWLSRGGVVVGSSPSLSSPLGPLFLGLPQSSLPAGTPQFPLLQAPSTAVVQVRYRTAISQSSRSSVVLSILSFSPFHPPPSRHPTSLTQGALSGLPESMTQLEQQFLHLRSLVYW